MVKVLIVDDEPAMLLAMRRLLERLEGVELAGAFRNAGDALALVREREVHLAILDIRIAEDSGLELAHRLREVRAELDIVFVTSHADYALVAYESYPLDYMIKPVSRERLEQTIARVADRRKAAGGNADSLGEDASLSPRLTVKGLGSFEVSGGQAEPVKWISQKSQELLGYLLVRRGRSVAKGRVLEDLFPDMPVKNAETYLNTAVYQLRKAFAPHGWKSRVESAQEQYRIELEGADVDFIAFEQTVTELAGLNENNEAAAIKLEQRYAGDLFEDKSYLWAMVERERLADLYDSFAKRLADHLLERRLFGEAVSIAKRIVARNELNEEAIRLLLHIFAEMGDRASLRRYYERYAQLQLSELGVPPAAALEELYGNYR